MKSKIFNDKIDLLYKELKKSYIETIENEFQDGQNAATNRIFSLLKEKKSMFDEIYENPNKQDIKYFFYDFFLHIEEDIEEIKEKIENNPFLKGFFEQEESLLKKIKIIVYK